MPRSSDRRARVGADRHSGFRVSVSVQTRASRDNLTLAPDGTLRASLTAPPVDNAANAALCTLVSKTLDIPKRSVCIVAGLRSRRKVLSIQGITEDTLLAALLSS